MKKKTEIIDILERDGIEQDISKNTSKPYSFRKLVAKDVNPMIKILRKIKLEKIKELLNSKEIKNLIKNKKDEQEENNTDNLIDIGKNLIFDAIPMILDSLDDCLEDVNKLLASVANMEVAELENLDFNTYFNLIYDFINKEEFSGFLKVASKFLNTAN